MARSPTCRSKRRGALASHPPQVRPQTLESIFGRGKHDFQMSILGKHHQWLVEIHAQALVAVRRDVDDFDVIFRYFTGALIKLHLVGHCLQLSILQALAASSST